MLMQNDYTTLDVASGLNKPKVNGYVTGRVQAQTIREWVYEYSYGGKVWPAIWGNPPEGYICVPNDFDPKFKNSNGGKVKTKARVRIRI